MHEFHLWVGLSDSPEETDDEAVARVVEQVQARITAAAAQTGSAHFDVSRLNGQWFLTATGWVNRRTGRAESALLDEIVDAVARQLPGSWGLVYERDDEMPEPVGPNAFRVRRIARGAVTDIADPFLSPCAPSIED